MGLYCVKRCELWLESIHHYYLCCFGKESRPPACDAPTRSTDVKISRCCMSWLIIPMCVRSEMRAVPLHSIFVLIIRFRLGFGLNCRGTRLLCCRWLRLKRRFAPHNPISHERGWLTRSDSDLLSKDVDHGRCLPPTLSWHHRIILDKCLRLKHL